jgi:flagellar hook-basal body complex protein FliE
MSQIEIDRVLSQIRSIAAASRAGSLTGMGALNGATPTAPTATNNGFANLLKAGLEKVNATQESAGSLATKFEKGVPGVELPQVMLEMQKANISFRALTEVRNKFVDAYREIMNMPL